MTYLLPLFSHLEAVVYVGVSSFDLTNQNSPQGYLGRHRVQRHERFFNIALMFLRDKLTISPAVQMVVLADGNPIGKMNQSMIMAGYSWVTRRSVIKGLILTGNTFKPYSVGDKLMMLKEHQGVLRDCIRSFKDEDIGAPVYLAKDKKLIGIHGPRKDNSCFITEGIWSDHKQAIITAIKSVEKTKPPLPTGDRSSSP